MEIGTGLTSNGCANDREGPCEIYISIEYQTADIYGPIDVDPDIAAIAQAQIAITLAHESYHAVEGLDPISRLEEYSAFRTETLVRLEMEAQGIEYSSLKYSVSYDINSFTYLYPNADTLNDWFDVNNTYYTDHYYPDYLYPEIPYPIP